MITFWTAASAQVLEATIGAALKAYRPNVPQHSFKPWTQDGQIVTPSAGGVVLVCGKRPLDSLQKAGVFPKNRTLSGLRERPVPHNGGHYLVTFDPASVSIEPTHNELIEWDLRLAHRLLTTGSLEPVHGKSRYVGSFADLIAWVKADYQKTGKPVDVSCDLETMGFYPWYQDKDIVSISFTGPRGTADVLYLGPEQPHPVPLGSVDLHDQITWLLTSPMVKLRMANGKYDLVWIAEKWGIECTNFKFDTMLVGSLVDENRSNSLNLHAKLFTPYGGYDSHFNATEDKSAMEKIHPDKLLPYAGGDTIACQAVADVLKDQLLEDDGMTRFYLTILHPAARAFEKIERRGVVIDREKYEVLGAELRQVVGVNQKKALEVLPNKLRIKHKDKIADQLAAGKNPLTPKLLKDFFFTPAGLNLKPKEFTAKSGEPSMTKSHLRQFADVPAAKEMVAILTEMDSAAKTLSTFVEGFLKHLRPDGRLHPTYFLAHGSFDGYDGDDAGTVSGRLSAKDPAIQCMVGETLVLTDRGQIRLDQIIEEGGLGYRVLTHTGRWRSVVGVYRNGVRPVFRVVLSSGRAIKCTGNHPVLTSSGFVRTDELKVGQKVFQVSNDEARAFTEEQENKNLSVLGRHENQMHQPEECGVGELRRARYYFPSDLGGLHEVPARHGGVPSGLHVRAQERGRRLQQAELLLGSEKSAICEYEGDETHHVSRRDSARRRLGKETRFGRSVEAPITERVVCGEGSDDAAAAYEAKFALAEIVSVAFEGLRETFDLTINACHSFVANGVVVHNTLPKKTSWGKKLRKCFPAPKGKVVLNCDFAQGELKVVACVANEKTMLKAYEDGLDLHAVTGAKLAGVDLKEFLSWKDNTSADLAALFDKHRGNAKPANFGLLYGMQVEGFRAYAWANYGIKLTFEEAEKMRNAFFELYPGLLGYHSTQRELVKLHQFVRTPLGRIRHLPTIGSWDGSVRSQAERQAINCLSDDTEILTARGWQTVDQVSVGDQAFSVDPVTGFMELCQIEYVHVGEVDGPMFELEHRSISAIATLNHRWLVDSKGRSAPRLKISSQLSRNGDDKVWTACNGVMAPATAWSDDEVALMGWVLTDGYYPKQVSPSGADWDRNRVGVTQSKASMIPEIDALFARLGKHSRRVAKTGQHVWEITHPASIRIRQALPDKTLTMEVLTSLSKSQLELLFVTMLKGDGCWDSHAGRWRTFCAGTKERADAFMMLCSMIGQPSRAKERDYSGCVPKKYDSMGNVPKAGKCWLVALPVNNRAQPQYGSKVISWRGRVWCPTLKHGTWVAKRNGKVFITGNSPIQGALTDMMIWAIALLEDAYPNSGLEIVAMIHDALIAYVPQGEEALWAQRVTDVMSSLPFEILGWKPQLKFTADAEIGPTLADLSKIKTSQ